MASIRFADMQSRPTEFLDFTSLTLEEFQQLVPPFEAAFQAQMAARRLDGKPRTARQFAVYKHCPLPRPEDRLFFLLTYLKTYALQVVQGRLFGMGQSKANQLRLSRFMVYCASHHRRYHSWHIYSSPACRTARRSSWI
jgi:hypothetical protein